MYQAAAEKWVTAKIASHAAALYAHDTDAVGAMFSYGFGLRCIDAIRLTEPLEDLEPCRGVYFEELGKADVARIRNMRRMLSSHLGKSPCFMRSTEEDVAKWLARAESRDSRVFAAEKEKTPVAYIEVSPYGETFVTEYPDMRNICGAFCLPEYRGGASGHGRETERGGNIARGLLNHILLTLKSEGFRALGVDFESFNPTALGFWTKNFTPYTKSVVRRIDDCAFF
jgi:GNAT superfamily N-acetyltransferase